MKIARRTHIPSCHARGFTFLEIMLVVMIIGIMLAIVGPRLVGKSKKAQITACKQQMENITTALKMFEMHTGAFQTTEQGLESLVTRPSGVAYDQWEQCQDKMPLDPWKQPFVYACPSEHGGDFDLSSPGPDKRPGTEDDITNWSSKDAAPASK